jgi:hypothetical protein
MSFGMVAKVVASPSMSMMKLVTLCRQDGQVSIARHQFASNMLRGYPLPKETPICLRIYPSLTKLMGSKESFSCLVDTVEMLIFYAQPREIPPELISPAALNLMFMLPAMRPGHSRLVVGTTHMTLDVVGIILVKLMMLNATNVIIFQSLRFQEVYQLQQTTLFTAREILVSYQVDQLKIKIQNLLAFWIAIKISSGAGNITHLVRLSLPMLQA